jgi:hypothetical protein
MTRPGSDRRGDWRGYRTPGGEELIRAAMALSPVERQNRMMRVGDREIALAMLFLGEAEQNLLLDCLSPAKRARVRDELSLQKRLRIRRELQQEALGRLIHALGAERGSAAASRGYLRPLRGGSRSSGRPGRPDR